MSSYEQICYKISELHIKKRVPFPMVRHINKGYEYDCDIYEHNGIIIYVYYNYKLQPILRKVQICYKGYYYEEDNSHMLPEEDYNYVTETLKKELEIYTAGERLLEEV